MLANWAALVVAGLAVYYVLTQESEPPSCARFEKLAHSGSAQAMADVGICYQHGLEGYPMSPEKALEWFKKASDAENADGMFLFAMRSEEAGDSASACPLFEQAAAKGQTSAMARYGICLREGKHVDGDQARALALFKESAEAGNIEGMNALSTAYANGLNGIEVDVAAATNWARKAAEAGHPQAMFNLANAYQMGKGVFQDSARASEWMEKSARVGYTNAQVNLGKRFLRGVGVAADNEQAVFWLTRAAEAGSLDALFELSNALHGTDEAKARDLMTQAATAGYAEAQFALGTMFYHGHNVEQNYDSAFLWLHRAALQGHVTAMYNLAVSFDNGEGTDEDKEAAVQWFRKAADLGNADAIFSLGVKYYVGDAPVAQDEDKGCDYFRRAAQLGHSNAQFNVEVCDTPEEMDDPAQEYLEEGQDEVDAAKAGIEHAQQREAPTSIKVGA